jgi:hypothetical protein
LIEFTNENPAAIGYIYDPETGMFSQPNIDENDIQNEGENINP